MQFRSLDLWDLWHRFVQAVFGLIDSLAYAYQEDSTFRAITDGFVIFAGLFTVDLLTGFNPGFDPIYLAPAWYAARQGGKRPAYLVAAFSATVLAIVDTKLGLVPKESVFLNTCLRWLVFYVLVRLVVNLETRLETYERLATRDSLTGLYNRVAFEGYAREQIAQAHDTRQSLVLAMIDCNDFKSLNDEFGHAYGDHVLKLLGRHLRRNVRSHGFCARTGGDEFVVVLPNRTTEDAYQMLEKVNAQLEDSTRIDGSGATISFGLARLGQHGDTIEELMRSADRYMYIAKSGKAVVKIPSPVRMHA